jgi:hypothetical protein
MSEMKNFSTHALEDILKDQYECRNSVKRGKLASEQDWYTYREELIRWIEEAQKFTMLEDDAHSVPAPLLGEWINDDPRLPFDFTVVEVTPADTGPDPDVELLGVVLVCASLHAISPEIRAAIKEDVPFSDDSNGFAFWPVMKTKWINNKEAKEPHWVCCPTLGVMMSGEDMAQWQVGARPEQLHKNNRDATENCMFVQHIIDSQMMGDQFTTDLEDGTGKQWDELLRDGHLERYQREMLNNMGSLMVKYVKTLAAFNTLINTKNIELRTHRPSPKLNKKRAKRGHPLFYEYKVLDLYPDRVEYAGGEDRMVNDRHGPRCHLRRGHVRRLHTGGTTFVRQAIIGQAQDGVILKDYKVETSRKNS